MKNVIEWHGEAVSKAIREAALAGLREAGEYIRGEAVQETPIESGDLRKSLVVTDNGKNTVYVSSNLPYALKQHEELGYHHPGGGKAKYLEDPLNRSGDVVVQIVVKSLQDQLKE